MDRVTAKRLLARLGVDNGNYEYYLEYPNYETWKRRKQIINAIEDDRLSDAESLLDEYASREDNTRNKSRDRIERQFYLFMKLQIMKHKAKEEIWCKAPYDIVEKALKLTVPGIDNKPLSELRLSPVEIALVLEYRIVKYTDASLKEKLCMYEELIYYIENILLGTFSSSKIYPKIVVYMYKDICRTLVNENEKDAIKIYEKMYEYCEIALGKVKKRKLIYYLTELL
ncbi:MAG: hypothetical protein IJV71_02250, partial [Lachnospiraceae bacterium]|nr:hypothetical protein [Lachnospiraceae bacterium]